MNDHLRRTQSTSHQNRKRQRNIQTSLLRILQGDEHDDSDSHDDDDDDDDAGMTTQQCLTSVNTTTVLLTMPYVSQVASQMLYL